MEFMRKSDIREVMLCGICDDVMKNPKLLNCLHSFCCVCLERCDKTYITAVWCNNTQFCYVPCPTCNQLTGLNSGVKQLRQDLRRTRLSEIITQPPLHLCEVCPVLNPKSTPMQSTAKWMCKECKDCMCKACAFTHKSFPLFSNHELVTIADSQKNHEFCQQHPLKKKDIYCDHCEVLLCSLCTRTHRQHQSSLYDANEYSVHCSKHLENLISRLDEMYDFPDFEIYQDRLTGLRKVNDGLTELSNKVTEHASTIIKDIQEQENQLHHSIEKSRALLQDWNDWADETKALRPHVESLVEKSELYSQSKNPADLLPGFKTLFAKVRKGVRMYGQNNPSVESLKVPIDFVPEAPPISIGKIVNIIQKDVQAENKPHCEIKYSRKHPKKGRRKKRRFSR